ncbi:MAG: ATP-binding protein [bacterium]
MSYFAFSGLVNVITNILLGSYVLYKGFNKPLNQSYTFYAFSVAFWSFGYFFWQMASVAEIALFWSRMLMAGAIIIPAAYFNLSLWISGKYHEKRLEAIFSLVLGFSFSILNFTPLIVKGVSRKMYFEFWPEPGLLYPLFLLMFFYYVVYSLVILYKVYAKASGHLKAQIMYVFVGTAIAFGGGSTNYFLWYDIPIPPVANILVTAYPLLMAYAITKHHLMDISVVISRTIAEVFSVLLLGSVYVTSVLFYRTQFSTLIDLPFVLLTVVYGVFVGQVHQRLRLFIQTSADKLFLRGKYNYYKELSEASARVGRNLSLSAILGVLYDTFQQVIEIEKPRIMLPNTFTDHGQESDRYVVFDPKTHEAQSGGEEILNNDPIIAQLIEKRLPIVLSNDPKRALIVPCMLEERLIAIFVLGHKLSEESYTNEDINLLSVLASQAAIALDHTRSYEKIKTDLEAAERQLARSERLAGLGTLTAGVTHEIRNPLTVIRSEADRLPNKPRSAADLKAFRELTLKHIDRISDIVQRMLDLAKSKQAQKAIVDLQKVLENSLQCFKFNGIKLRTELQPIKSIKGNEGELQEVFVNLVQNAMEAMGDHGMLIVRTYNYNDGQKSVIEFEDTGKGIPSADLERIFNPFFSSRHEGTGLGLSIVHRIISEHDGEISVESEVGKGTTFKIVF